ncbi:hypothetical protein [Mycolicibacterium farcinogenes]|uniref:Uncharacterized protein n=1 Tax=Mycolicibacterium farcinogenes TaxID=1802 RepID=A0ACD1FD80_MYCFR|nr:hypothetical protein [Mycolicibacterium farcinogenes]QZH65024.1 hypothetical protein K6L26_23935 [Mycolicibacterium farcinogenes]
MDLVQWLPLVGGLGVGSVIGNYIGAGRARREVRGAVLKAIEATEMARWAPTSYREFRTAYREVETSALIARIPRTAVHHYLVLAEAGRQLSDESYEELNGDEDFGAGAINGHLSDVVSDAAGLITRLAWRPWWTRMLLRKDLKGLRDRTLEISDDFADVKRKVAVGQRNHGVLPGPLGEIPGIKVEPPSFPESHLNEFPSKLPTTQPD